MKWPNFTLSKNSFFLRQTPFITTDRLCILCTAADEPRGEKTSRLKGFIDFNSILNRPAPRGLAVHAAGKSLPRGNSAARPACEGPH